MLETHRYHVDFGKHDGKPYWVFVEKTEEFADVDEVVIDLDTAK